MSLTGPSLSLMDLFLACTAGDFDLDLERPREEAVTFRLEEGGGGERSRGESRRPPPAPTVTVKFGPSAMTFLEWGESESSSDFGLLWKMK